MHRYLMTWTAVASLFLPAVAARAQTVSALVHAFTIEPAFPGPVGELMQASDGTIYGTASWIGPSHNGVIYALRKQPDGAWRRTILHAFQDSVDGANPVGGLIEGRDGAIYGTAQSGGGGGGTVFKVSPAGVFTTLTTFSSPYPFGASPTGRLLEASDGNFYGTTAGGDGPTTFGTIFRMTPAGAMSLVHVFDGFLGGSRPAAGLIQAADGDLYGTTEYGGSQFDRFGLGTVFRVTLSGEFTVLHRFTPPYAGGNPTGALLEASDGLLYGTAAQVFTITAEGAFRVLAPELREVSGTLIEGSDGVLYGTQYGAAVVDGGAVFRMMKTGAWTILHEFWFPAGTKPNAGVIEGQDGLLYGTTTLGGRWSRPPADCSCVDNDEFPAAWGSGTVFQIEKTGGLTTVMEFDAAAGLVPVAPLLRAGDGNFYGTTYAGGTTVDVPGGRGTVFAMTADGAVRTLHSFSDDSPFYPGDVDESFHPTAGLVQGSDGALYGTTARTIFRVTPDNVFTQLHVFTGPEVNGTISGLLAASDGALYGTTSHGGAFGFGTVFRITTTGEFTVLQSFSGPNGARPYAALVEASGALFGTTTTGGAHGLGTIFRLASAGLTVLHSFNFFTGAAPVAALTHGVDGQLYGTAPIGGLNDFAAGGSGTLFRVTLSGTVTLLHSFSRTSGVATPLARLVQAADGALYGTTYSGAVFGIAATGSGFRRVATLGVPLFAGLAEGPGGALYGTAPTGGPDGYGFVFKIVP